MTLYLTSIRSVRDHSYCAYALSDSIPSHIEWELVQRAVHLRGLWHSQRTIAYMLGMTQGAFSNILRRHRETGDTGPRPRSGHPWVTTDREDRSLVRMQLRSCFQSAPSLRSEWETAARRPARVPALMRDHRRTRRRWSHDHRNWQVGHWRHCVLAEESRFALHCHNDRRLVHRRQGERLLNDCVHATHGNRTASVMVLGAIHHDAKSELVFINGTLNRFQYVDILRNSMVLYARTTFHNNFMLVHDNATCHPARHTRGFLTQEQVEVMPWPENWPDMNPIQHVCDQMGVYIRNMANPSKILIELRQAPRQAWDSLTLESIQHLVDAGVMPRRVIALSPVCGGHTQY